MILELSRGGFFIEDPKSLWKCWSLYDLDQEAHTPWEWHNPIYDRCRQLGLICFGTSIDATSVDFLETLETPYYQIASFEDVNIPLIKRVAATGKPIIISTGMASIAELDDAVTVTRQVGCKDLFLLKCTSSYSAILENTNILTIPHLRELFDCEVGLSDHMMGVGVIEKHSTLSRVYGGVGSAFSLVSRS